MNRIAVALIFVLVFTGLVSKDANAQCKQQLVYSCATENGRAIYLRDFNAKLKKSKPGKPAFVARFSVVLNKGTRYRLNLCNPNGYEDRTMLILYDAKKEYGKTFYNADEVSKQGILDLVKKNYKPEEYSVLPDGGIMLQKFDFVCEKSGVYFVAIQYMEGFEDRKGCAVGILSFVGKNK